MDLKEIFEGIADKYDWFWSYGTRDNHNLLNNTEDFNKVYLAVDPIKRQDKINVYGGVDGCRNSGFFFIGLQSNFDDVDDKQRGATLGRYDKYTKRLIEIELPKLLKEITCLDSYNIVFFEHIEAKNIFDANLDGLIVQYTLEER
jgi:hypothetical protein